MKHRHDHTATAVVIVLFVLTLAATVEAQLAADWMVPAAAHNPGSRGTFWMTDLSLHNPHDYELPVVVQALPSDTVNGEVPTLTFELYPWETLNLWDVLGPGVFDLGGTAALLVYADPDLVCDPIEDCHLLVTSRTFTPENGDGVGEFGLTVPGSRVGAGNDWSSLGYAAGILNDGTSFRCNVGVASWTPEWTTVQLDVQSADGYIEFSEIFEVPPFGHVQRRLPDSAIGGSLVFYVTAGPSDSLVFPYATVINQETGDGSYLFAEASGVGSTVTKQKLTAGPRPTVPPAGDRVELPKREGLHRRNRVGDRAK